MQVVILADTNLRSELEASGMAAQADVIWIEDVHAFHKHRHADVFVDLLFENTPARLQLLNELLPQTVIINSVVDNLASLGKEFIRINGWPGFLKGSLIEAVCLQQNKKTLVQEVFAAFGKQVEWLPDNPGFITPRIISMIINEAYFALGEGVSTPAEIDTAMKLGTNYPYGPIEWGNKIGLQNVADLLNKMSEINPRYKPAEWLVQETNKAI